MLEPCSDKEKTNDTHKKHVAYFTENYISKKNDSKYNILLGNSLFENIPQEYVSELNSYNFSVGGDSIQHLLYRTFYIENNINDLTENFKNVEKIIILIGTNNMGKYNGNCIYDNIVNYINIINHINKSNKDIKIYVLAIPPRTYKPDKKNSKNAKYLRKITKNTEDCNNLLKLNKEYIYCDLTFDFATIENGLYVINENLYIDEVHFSKLGYEIIIERLKTMLN